MKVEFVEVTGDSLANLPEELRIKCIQCGHEWEDWDEYGGPMKCSECGHVPGAEIELSPREVESLGRELGQGYWCYGCLDVTTNIIKDDVPKCIECGDEKLLSEYNCPRCGAEGGQLIEITDYGKSGIPWDAHGHSWIEERRCLICGKEFGYSNADY